VKDEPYPTEGLSLDELEAETVVQLPSRDLLAAVNLSVLGLVTVSAEFSASVSVLGLVDASIT